MKDPSKKLKAFAQKLQESQQGRLEGGFLILVAENAILIGGQEANNCNGGNCAQGCGLNTAAGCGGTVNSVAGCGTKNQQISR